MPHPPPSVPPYPQKPPQKKPASPSIPPDMPPSPPLAPEPPAIPPSVPEPSSQPTSPGYLPSSRPVSFPTAHAPSTCSAPTTRASHARQRNVRGDAAGVRYIMKLCLATRGFVPDYVPGCEPRCVWLRVDTHAHTRTHSLQCSVCAVAPSLVGEPRPSDLKHTSLDLTGLWSGARPQSRSTRAWGSVPRVPRCSSPLPVQGSARGWGVATSCSGAAPPPPSAQ